MKEKDLDDITYPDLNQHELLMYGIEEIAYIREADLKGQHVYVVYAADGTPISAQENYSSAISAAYQHELDPITLH